MAQLFDTHLHTRRHSGCSQIDEWQLIPAAVKAGLDGIVITEHHYQWTEAELQELVEAAEAPGFVVLAGFEYTARQGDILVYGLPPDVAESIEPYGDAVEVLDRFHAAGAFCVAAHPTRAGMGFDETIAVMPFDALEVKSVNLQPHEQRLAANLAAALEKPATMASDAHQLHDVGAYGMTFEDPVRGARDLQQALKRGRFRVAGRLR